jgi:hypothetical protein
MRPVASFVFIVAFALLVPVATPSVRQAQPNDAELADDPMQITRDWIIHFVAVNYGLDLVNSTILTEELPTQRVYSAGGATIVYNVHYDFSIANESYTSSLRQVMMTDSVNGSETGTRLDEDALEYQKLHPDEPQRIFYPRAGRAIDAYAVEDWLIANPAVTPPDLGYVFYMLNFSELDTPGHGLEHWYDYRPVDPDSGRKQDWFRLEWDNALNQDVRLEYAGFGGRGNIYVLDPSADQWYLRWARIWWSDPPYEYEYQHCTMDLEDKVSFLNLSTPAGRLSLNSYLRDYIYDPIAFLMVPSEHATTAYVSSGLLKVLVFCMDVTDGISIDSLKWVTNAEMQARYLCELLPFIPWQVDVQYLDIQNYTSWNSLFWQYAQVIGEKVIVDGGQMFEAIYEQMRPQYVNTIDPNVNVFGVVFVKKNMEMHVYGRTYTGLGGGGQTVIWKSWERYYRPDGVTPKSGVSATQLHETMHAMGFGHTWSNYHYVADFSYGPMGYFGSHNGTSTFDRNWAQSTYLDQMQAHLQALFETRRQAIQSSDPPKVFLAEQKALDAFSLAQQRYGHMDWHGCYEALCAARDWTKRLTYSISDHDPPLFRAWGMIPETFSSSNFTVWARVEDDLAGLENVSVHALVNGTTDIVFACTFNGGNYTTHVPDLGNSNTLSLWVEAYDWGMNKAESNHIRLIGETELAISWDAMSITLVTSTVLGAVAVAVLAYKKTRV